MDLIWSAVEESCPVLGMEADLVWFADIGSLARPVLELGFWRYSQCGLWRFLSKGCSSQLGGIFRVWAVENRRLGVRRWKARLETLGRILGVDVEFDDYENKERKANAV
jgi:hypothetical protein